MGTARKLDNELTSMQVLWTDKDLLSLFKRKKTGKSGIIKYESDADVFSRVMLYYAQHVKPVSMIPQATYPALKNITQAG